MAAADLRELQLPHPPTAASSMSARLVSTQPSPMQQVRTVLQQNCPNHLGSRSKNPRVRRRECVLIAGLLLTACGVGLASCVRGHRLWKPTVGEGQGEGQSSERV